MKSILKSLVCLTLAMILLTSVFCINSFAAGTIISFSSKSVAVGETITVTVTLDAGEAMYGVGCVINYDDSRFEYASGASAGGGGTLQIIESPSGETKVSYSISFKALASGSGTFSVADCRYESLTESKGLSGASATATVTDASLSGNANLSALSISEGVLSPKFSQNRTTYTVTVPNSVTDFSVYATAADAAASVSAPSSTSLKIGKNVIKVIVTAANGTQKTYTLNVTRSETEEVEDPEDTPATENTEITVNIDEISYTVVNDLTNISMLTGFTASTADYKGNIVTVATDSKKEITVYYLKSPDSEELVPYLYNAEDDAFERLRYITRNNNTYIICDIPSGKTYPNQYFLTNTTVDSFDIKCLSDALSSTNEFYYIYCFNGSSYCFYRLDTKENSLQRFPELVLSNIATEVNESNEGRSFPDRFKALTANAKITIIAFIIFVLFIIAIVVLIIIRTVHKNRYNFQELLFDFENEFDDIEVEKDETDDLKSNK